MARQPYFRLDFREFLKGNNSFEDYPDGGFTESTVDINVYNKPGYLSSFLAFVDKTTTTNVPYPAVAFGVGPAATGLGGIAVALGTNNSADGYFYRVATDGTFTQPGAADTGRDYGAGGFCDVVYYNSKWYFTSRNDMVESTLDLVTAVDTSWWITTKGKAGMQTDVPHPQLVYGDIRYVADGNVLHQDDHGTISLSVFDLPVGWVITALEVYNNLIYMAAEPYKNASGTFHGAGKIFTWDGYSESWIDEYNVGDRISTFYVFDGILFAFTPYYLGYFNGSIVKPLRALSAPNTTHNQVFKCQVTSIGNSMFFIDGYDLIRYGHPSPVGKRFFSKMQSSDVNSPYVGLLAFESKELIVARYGATSGKSQYLSDVDALTTDTTERLFTFNERVFSDAIKIRKVVIKIDGNLSSGQQVKAYHYDDKGNLQTDYTFDEATFGAQQRRKQDVVKGSTFTVKPVVGIKKGVKIKYIDYFYEASEGVMNK